MDILEKDMAAYKATALARWKSKQEKLDNRRKKAWAVAKKASEFLKQKYHAKKVMIFGSMVHNYWYSETSDIDLAVWGINPDLYFNAIAELQGISYDYKIDMVSCEKADKNLLQSIFDEGKEL